MTLVDRLRRFADDRGEGPNADMAREAAAEIERLQRDLAAKQWQPIETAPKDGKAILIGREDDDVGCDPVEITNWVDEERYRFELVEGDLYRKIRDETCGFWNGNGHRATHWMPLPPAPTANKGDAS